MFEKNVNIDIDIYEYPTDLLLNNNEAEMRIKQFDWSSYDNRRFESFRMPPFSCNQIKQDAEVPFP